MTSARVVRPAAVALALVAFVALGRSSRERAEEERASWPQLEGRVSTVFARAHGWLGYRELAADVAWAQTLVYYGDGLTKGFSLREVEPLIALVNELDPRFRRPYLWGALAAVYRQGVATQEEFRASVEILERGVAVFPDDWEMNWVLGLRYHYDLKSDDPEEQRRFKELGADYLERAMRCPGAPQDLALLASTMRTALGQHERALAELREMIVATEDPKAREKLIQRYQALTSEGDATALRTAKEEFDRRKQSDLPYVPDVLYPLIGDRPEPFDLRRLAEGPGFDSGEDR